MTTEVPHVAEPVTEPSLAFPTEAFQRVGMHRGLCPQRQVLQHPVSVEACVCVGPVCVGPCGSGDGAC